MAFGIYPAATTGSALNVTSSAAGTPRIGIGGILPVSTLHIYTTGSGDTPITVTTSGSSGDSDVFNIDLTGSVGIGTIPVYRLDIAPNIASAFRIKGTTAGQDVNCAIENTGDQSTDDVLMSYTTQAGAGDPSIRFAIAGNETYSMGIDNSDGDKLKISAHSSLATDTRLTLHGPKLGINQSSPTFSLDVTGDGRFTTNLTVGGNVLPSQDEGGDLGSATKRWANLYTGDLHLKNDRGDWTIVEEKDYLSVINNKTGKKYKMVLQEVEE